MKKSDHDFNRFSRSFWVSGERPFRTEKGLKRFLETSFYACIGNCHDRSLGVQKIEPACGSSVGFPDLLFPVIDGFVPVELKEGVDRIDLNPAQWQFHVLAGKAEKKSFVVCGSCYLFGRTNDELFNVIFFFRSEGILKFKGVSLRTLFEKIETQNRVHESMTDDRLFSVVEIDGLPPFGVFVGSFSKADQTTKLKFGEEFYEILVHDF